MSVTPLIKVNDVDVTDAIRYADAMFASQVNGIPGPCQFAVRDLAHTRAFTSGQTITLDIDGDRRWTGYVLNVQRQFSAEVVDTTTPATVARWFLISGIDVNVLFGKRVTYDKDDPTKVVALPPDPSFQDSKHAEQWAAGTHSDDIVKYVITNDTDLLADGVDLSGVDDLGSPNPDLAAAFGGAQTVGDFMRTVNRLLGGIWYLKPDFTLVHRFVETATTDYFLSDAASGDPNRIGPRDYSITSDADQMVNDALVWGTAAGVSVVKFSRAQDTTEQAKHGRWQSGEFNTSMYKQTSLDTRSHALVYGNDASQHGAHLDRVVCQATVFEPVFFLGDVVLCEAQVYTKGSNQEPPFEASHTLQVILPVRQITITFPTPTDAKFDMILAQELDDPWSAYEFRFPKFKGIDPGGGVVIGVLPGPDNPGGCPDTTCIETVIYDAFQRSVGSGWDFVWDDSFLGLSTALVDGTSGQINTPIHISGGAMRSSVNGPWFASEWTLVTRFVDVNDATVFPFAIVTSTGSIGFAYGGTSLQISDLLDVTHDTFTHAIGTSAAWVKMHYKGGVVLEAKVWADGDPEPADYQVYGPPAAFPDATSYIYIGAPARSDANDTMVAVDVIQFEVNHCAATQFENFERAISPNGWGDATPGGQTWTEIASSNRSIYVADGYGVIENGPTGSGSNSTIAVASVPFAAASDFSVLVECVASDDVHVRVAAFEFDGFSFEWNAVTGGSELVINGGGDRETVSFDPNFWANLIGTAYFRAERVGAVARMKLWDSGVGEPGWMLTGTSTYSSPTYAGFVSGILHNQTSGVGSQTIKVGSIDFDYPDKPCFQDCGHTQPYDPFTRVESNGWGDSPPGPSWTRFSSPSSPDSDWSVDGSKAIISGSNSDHSSNLAFGGTRVEWYVEAQLTANAASPAARDYVFFGADTPGDYCEIDISTNGALNMFSGFENTTGTFDPTVPFAIRMHIENNIAKCKIWALSDPEPDWMYIGGITGDMIDVYMGTGWFDNPTQSKTTEYDNFAVSTCADVPTQPPAPGIASFGAVCETLIQLGGTDFITTRAFIPGSLEVWVNGARKTPTTFDGPAATFSLAASITITDVLRVCYVANGEPA